MENKYRELTIDEFIKEFKKHDSGKALITTFIRGFCYYFSIILKERFPEGKIMYSLYNHFLFSYRGKLYDITGDVTEQYPSDVFEWSTWNSDELHRERIIRDCIRKDFSYR